MIYKMVDGKDVPDSAVKLTRGDSGLMKFWLYNESSKMRACLAYQNDKLVGWCCYLKVPEKKFLWWSWNYNTTEISTFVDKKHRKQGIGKQLLSHILRDIRRQIPGAKVRYGAPEDSGFFNQIYDKLMIRHKLIPVRFWCKE